jgi:PelA/Pel-15E family pectate lyase
MRSKRWKRQTAERIRRGGERTILLRLVVLSSLVSLLAMPLHAAEDRPRNFPRDWWPEMQAKPDEWYASDDAKRIATNILSWQDESGGWPLMQTINEPWNGDESAVGPWGRRGALIKATVNEIRFLARAYRVTKDPRYLQAAVEGIDFILRAQWPSGGWPHSYPHFRNPYDRYATFNDDETVDLMRLLREVATAPDFDPLSQEKKDAARRAFDRGIDFILKSQIVVDGRRTVWAQQHDEVTLEPRAARAFEPVALSAGESAGVLKLLMSIERPSQAIIDAVHAGAAWYEAVKIQGIRIQRTADDRLVVEDPHAPPIWARFNQIGTNRPIFAGRDGVIRFRLADIEKERRGGYAWYGDWGRTVLEQYAKWRTTVAVQSGSRSPTGS